eukprot:5159_1
MSARQKLKYLCICIIVGWITIYVYILQTGSFKLTNKTLYYHLTTSLHTYSNITNNSTFVIGLGSQKCSSTTFQGILESFINQSNIIQQSNHTFISPKLKNSECNYWSLCIFSSFTPSFIHHIDSNFFGNKLHFFPQTDSFCSIYDYINHCYSNDENINNHKNKIYFEKTPGYFYLYHSAFLLSAHIHSSYHNIFLYILFRNPIHRTWSQYWSYNSRLPMNQRLNPNNESDIKLMMNRIENDIGNFNKDFPYLYEILQDLNDTNIENQLFFEKLVTAIMWKSIELPALFQSCYYVFIVLWKYTFDNIDMHKMKVLKFSERFKIIQTEYWINHKNDTMYSLLEWINLNEMNVRDDMFDWNKVYSKLRTARKAPKGFDIMQYSVAKLMNNFLSCCNHKLYEFVDKYPNILLSQSKFIHWSTP